MFTFALQTSGNFMLDGFAWFAKPLQLHVRKWSCAMPLTAGKTMVLCQLGSIRADAQCALTAEDSKIMVLCQLAGMRSQSAVYVDN